MYIIIHTDKGDIKVNVDKPPTEDDLRRITYQLQQQKILPLPKPEEIEKPSIITQKFAEMPLEKISETSAVFASNFAPILKLFLTDEEKKTLEDLQKQHPVSSIIGTITGSIAELSLMSPVGRVVSSPVMKFLSKTPRLARFIGSGVRSGITFAGQGLLRESVEQATKKELNVKKLLESTLINLAFGTGIGTTEQIMSIPVRTAISSAVAGSATALENYIKEKKIHPVDVLVNAAIVGGFTALTGKQVSEDIRKQIENNLREVIKKKIITTNPDISPIVVDKATNSFINAYFNEVYKRGGRFPTPKEIEDFAGAIAQGWKIYIENPIGIKANIDPEFNKRLTMAISPINYPGETRIVPAKLPEIKAEVKPPRPIPVGGEVKPSEPIPVKGKVVKTPITAEKPPQPTPISEEVKPETKPSPVETEVKPIDFKKDIVLVKPDKYYIYEKTTKSFEEVEGQPIKIKGFEDHDFFIWKTPQKTWRVVEGKTGLMVAEGKTKREAIQEAEKILNEKGREKTINIIESIIVDPDNLSPRYLSKIKVSPEVKEIMKYKSPHFAYKYAKELGRRVPELEPLIKQDPHSAQVYAEDVIKGRWPEAEWIIKTEPATAYHYACYVIKGRWPEAEEIIKQDPFWSFPYAKNVIKGRWPEAEEIIKQDPQIAVEYAFSVLKKRWPEAEPIIIKDEKAVDRYCFYFNLKVKGDKFVKPFEEEVEPLKKVPYEDWKIKDEPEPLTSIPIFPEPNPEDVKKINDTRLAVILASQIIKKFPGVSGRLKTSLGLYIPKTKDIVLNAEIFKNTSATLKTILHEIGHAVDRVLLTGSERTNLLGRLNALHDFVKKTFQGVSEKEVQKECLKVSEHFFGKERIEYYLQKKGYMPSAELYADFFAGILLDPITTRKLAPKASKMFWDGINKNNEIADILRRTLEITPTEIDEAVNQILRLGFSKELTNEDLINLTRAKLYERNTNIESLVKEMVEKNILELEKNKQIFEKLVGKQNISLKEEFIDKNIRLEKVLKQLLKENKISKDDYLDILDTLSMYVKTPIALGELEFQKFVNIINPYLERGLNIDDINLVLYYKRLISEEEIANSLGIKPEHIPSMLKNLEKELGQEKFQLINELVDKIKKWHDDVLNKATELGVFKKEDLEKWIQGYYAPIKTEKYLEEEVKPFFKKRVGTLEPAKQPLINLVFKTIAIRQFTERNMYKRKIFDKVIKNIPNVKKINASPYHQITPPEGMAELKFIRDCKWERYLIPKEVANFMNNNTKDDLMFFDKATNFFKGVFTRWNVGFTIGTNPLRDFTASIFYLGQQIFTPKLPVQYIRAFKILNKYVRGEITEQIEELINKGIIDSSVVGHLIDVNNLDVLFNKQDRLLSKLIENNSSVREKLLEELELFKLKLEKLGIISEKIHKVAGYLQLKERAKELNLSEEEIRYLVLNFMGSPNFYRVAKAKRQMEWLFPFYNAVKEGIRRFIEGLKNPMIRKNMLIVSGSLAITPAIIKILLEKGLIGSDIEDYYQDISPAMKIYYPIVFPLGETPDGDLVILRIPCDEMVATTHGFFYLLAKHMLEKEGIKDINDLFKAQEQLTKISFPSLNPALELAVDTSKAIIGEKPVEYRTKSKVELIGDKTADAFNLREIKMIIKDVKEGKDVVVNTSLRVPLLNRFLKIIPREQRYKNRLRNLGIE